MAVFIVHLPFFSSQQLLTVLCVSNYLVSIFLGTFFSRLKIFRVVYLDHT